MNSEVPKELHGDELMSQICCDADEPPCHCLATDLIDVLGRKYALDLVCVVAHHEPVRFGLLEEHLPDASTSTLSTRLDELETEGLLTRERYDEIPPRVEYELTDDGRELGERLRPVLDWIAERESNR
ncbi:winged helix-turn-helix transcriptional regulator [Halomicrobium zhouii]|nr:helix-turn-helix domain-containing protein [Halomicrobium zhouii]